MYKHFLSYLIRLNSSPKLTSLSTSMASSIVLPSVSLKSSAAVGSFRSSNGLGFRNDVRRISPWNVEKSRVYMSVAVGSQATTAVDDALFKDYKPSSAFLFPGQVGFRFLLVSVDNYSSAALCDWDIVTFHSDE